MNLVSLQENRVFRGWRIKWEPEHISSGYQDLTFTATVAFSEHHFYGIMINESANNSEIFRHFLISLIEIRDKFLIKQKENLWSCVTMLQFTSILVNFLRGNQHSYDVYPNLLSSNKFSR